MSADRFPDGAKIYEKLRSTTKLLVHFGVKDYRREWTKVTASIAEAGDAARLDLALGRRAGGRQPGCRTGWQAAPHFTLRFAAERVQFLIENQ
jgi:GntR family phosphonate transport system transcriptional regulator